MMNSTNAANASPIVTEEASVAIKCPHTGCNRVFTRKYALDEHVKSHTGERPHVCPVRTCAKRFTTSGNLSRHKRLHGYIEPLKCPVEGCVCEFPSNNKLEKHMKFHSGQSNKICPVTGCGKTFSTTGNLNRHLKNHHSQHEVQENMIKVMSVSVGSPISGDQFIDYNQTGDAMMPHWEPMASDFFQFAHIDEMDDIWSPAVLDTLQIILGNEPVCSWDAAC